MALFRTLPSKTPKIVLADVDDTVAPSTQPLGDPMAATLASLADKGFLLVFVSGGSVAQMTKQVCVRLPRTHHLLGTSGSHAVAVDAAGKQTELFKVGFSETERKEIYDALDALVKHFHVVPDTNHDDQVQDRGCQFTLSALGRGAADARKRAFDPEGSVRREWVHFLTDRLGDDRFTMRVGGTTSVDITAKGVDKATGVRRLLEAKGWKAEDGLYFGDRFEETGNDHPVLQVMDCVNVHGPEETLGHFKALLGR
jgi:HAD superfamily hydrolase (TIGR01484 family)